MNEGVDGKRVSTSAVGSGILAAVPRLGVGAELPRRERLPCRLRDPCGPGVRSVLSGRGQGAVGDLDLLGNLTLPLN